MAGIPDTRQKGKTIEAPPSEFDFKVNGKPMKLDASDPASGSRKVKMPRIQPGLSGKSASMPTSPHAAWSSIRIGQLVLAMLLVFAVLDGSAFIFIIFLVVFALLRQEEISKYFGSSWNRGWITEQWLEQLLPSQDCPDCGQSIFDRSVPGQYEAEFDWLHFLPAKACANCGHDHTVPVQS